MPPRVDVSVVIPVLNEAESLPSLLDSLEAQSCLPSEVIVVDGGSTDGTRNLVDEYSKRAGLPFDVRLIEADGARPGRGRNLGARAARHDIVACSDAGVTLHVDWLRHLIAPLGTPVREKPDAPSGERSEDEGAAREPSVHEIFVHEVAVGSFVARGTTLFERLIGILLIRPPKRVKLLYAGGVSIAFRKGAWERIGGYAEDTYPCEDAQFLRDLNRAQITTARATDALTFWRPRSTFRALWHQYRSYAWGDAMIQLGLHRHLLRASFYGLCLLGLSTPLWWTGSFGWIAAAAGGSLLAAYLVVPTVRAWRELRSAATWFLGPAILATKDLAQICGYIEGTWNRMRGGSRDFGRRAGHAASPKT